MENSTAQTDVTTGRENYLTPDLLMVPATYFTGEGRYRSFRVAECSAGSATRATFTVQLLWRDDADSGQKEIFVDTDKIDGNWLISGVRN